MRADQERKVLIFARAPVLGRVKTRLAADVGDAAALEIYQRLVGHTFSTLSDSEISGELWIAGNIDHPEVQAWGQQQAWPIYEQASGDLGERMDHAISDALKRSRRVVLIGVDCPQLGPQHLRRAFTILEENSKLVLGPARDGGYYLIGANSPISQVFNGVAWGSEDVLEQTLAKAREHALSYRLMDLLSDVDTLPDWQTQMCHLREQ